MKAILLILVVLFSCGWTFPLKEKDCYVINGRIRTTSWFYQKRVDLPKGQIYGAINWPTRSFAPVYAIKTGIVMDTGYDNILGVYINIRPTNTNICDSIIYGHLSDWDVAKGDKVIEGQEIGLTGHSGRTTLGPESRKGLLYLEGRKDGDKVCLSEIDMETGVSKLFHKKWKCIVGDMKGVNKQ